MTGTKIDDLLSEAAAAGDVPGAAAAVLDRDRVMYQGVGGRVRVDGDAEVTPNTIFWLASMTKALVAVGALQLVERGALDLDAEVASIVPEFGELQVLEGYDGDEPRLRPPASRATVRQLLTHTSGVGYLFLDADVARWHELTGVAEPLECSPDFLRAPLVADPGTRWDYGAGFDWAGRVVEEITGTTLDSYLVENVFAPLGMGDTTFRLRDDQRERLMPIHHRTADGGLDVDDELELPHQPPMSFGGHGPTAPSATTRASCACCSAAASSTASGSCGPRRSSSPRPLSSARSSCRRRWRRPTMRCPTTSSRCRLSRASASVSI
jgi:CubicO group peptidase (beta-lactamase class C family)